MPTSITFRIESPVNGSDPELAGAELDGVVAVVTAGVFAVFEGAVVVGVVDGVVTVFVAAAGAGGVCVVVTVGGVRTPGIPY